MPRHIANPVEHAKRLEDEGYHFEAADGSFELLMRREAGEYEPLFRLESWRVTVEKRGDVLVRWLRAQVKGWQWYFDNPEAVGRLTVEKFGPKGLDLKQQIAEAKLTAPLIMAGDGAKHGALWIDESLFRTGIEFGHEAGFVTADLKPTDVMTQELIKRAQA